MRRRDALFTLFTPILPVRAQELIRVDVRLVGLTVTVSSALGHPVSDLTKEDFEILEDGKPQPIALFANSKTARLELALAVDFSGSQKEFLGRHSQDIERFLKSAVQPGDAVRVVAFSTQVLAPGAGATVENAIRDLRMAARRFRWGGDTVLYDAAYAGVAALRRAGDRDRRALVLFTDGQDTQSKRSLIEIVEAAQNQGIIIYCIRYSPLLKGTRQQAGSRYALLMEWLAAETGGSEYEAAREDVPAKLKSIADQLRSSYRIAYYAPDSTDASAFRKTEVRVKRPGFKAASKTGYYVR